ncbi:MAG: glycosyltransferase family 2 protein [Desulfobacteraceae bacterium]|jgi:glycosyltransferase involved in cell wall biosynthesis|nr:glycosyltransferase family 2 protein [Desulfobacteraceae bacterium]
MFKDKSICVVVPAYNESTQIANVIQTMPEFVDKIVVVDDASQDNTVEIVKQQQNEIDKIEIIQHESNQGVGGAISSGYKWARDNECEVTAVMAGDGQMDPTELETIIMPIVDGSADYTKGNRLFYGDAWNMIPHHRYLGNSFFSLMTKIASGYWHVADSQSGYTAISLIALKRINLDKIYPDYGMPNDLLIKLNQHDFRVRDVHIRPVYNVGERSDIKMTRVIPRISWILFKGFWQRLFFKYVVRDFHPLIFFYLLSFFLLSFSVPLAIRLFYIWATRGDIPDMNALALIFTIISGLQTLFFGMWFDMEYNKNLK